MRISEAVDGTVHLDTPNDLIWVNFSKAGQGTLSEIAK